jgi:hypothetical protein
MIPLGIDPVTFQFVAQFLKKLVKERHLFAATVFIDMGIVRFFHQIFCFHTSWSFKSFSNEPRWWRVTLSIPGFLGCLFHNVTSVQCCRNWVWFLNFV